MQGIVIRNTGNSYVVRLEAGDEVSCKVKGNFRLKGIRTTNPVAVGDCVFVDFAEGGADGSLTVKKAKNTKIIGLQFGKTNFCSYLCSNTRYYHSRVFANL